MIYNTVGSFTATPIYNFSIDYGLSKKLSIGIATGYQTCKFNYQYSNGPIFDAFGNHEDNWPPIMIGVKGNYYIIANKNICLYTGPQLGYNNHSKTSTAIDSIPHGIGKDEERYGKAFPLSINAHFGFSYYFKGFVDLNTEISLGFGSPYLFAGAITFKL